MKKTIAFLVSVLMIMALIVPLIPVAASVITLETDTIQSTGIEVHQITDLGPTLFVLVDIAFDNANDAGLTTPDAQSILRATLAGTTEENAAARENYSFTLTITEHGNNRTWTVETMPHSVIHHHGRSTMRFATSVYESDNNFTPVPNVRYDVSVRITDAANNRVINILPYSDGNYLSGAQGPISLGDDGYIYSIGGFTSTTGDGGVRPIDLEGGNIRLDLRLPTADTLTGTAQIARVHWLVFGIVDSTRISWEVRLRAEGFDERVTIVLNAPPFNIAPRSVFQLTPTNDLRITINPNDFETELPSDTDFIVTLYATSQVNSYSRFRIGMFTYEEVGSPPDDGGNEPPPSDYCEHCGEHLRDCLALCRDQASGEEGEDPADWLIWAIVGGVVGIILIGGVVFVLVAKKKKD